MRKKALIITGISTIILVVMVIFIVKNSKNMARIKNYSDVISSNDISYIEYRTFFESKEEYRREEYVTLTDIEKDNFIKTLNGNEFKYVSPEKGAKPKVQYYNNTFIIYYNNGNKTYLDNVHIQKVDNNGNSIYQEYMYPYGCSMGQYLFLSNNSNLDIMVLKDFETGRYFFKKNTLDESDEEIKIRYYKLLNYSYTTDDYYDVVYNKNRIIVSISKSKFNLNNQTILPINRRTPSYDISDKESVTLKEDVIYHLTDKEAIPFAITYITFIEDGIEKTEIKGFNLYNGENVDYHEIYG